MKTDIINGQRVKCYDNGGKSFDRYSVLYMDCPQGGGIYDAVGMSDKPFNPQGFGQHGDFMIGPHLGKRVALASLPADCQKLVNQDTTHDQT